MSGPTSKGLILAALATLCLIWGTTWAAIQIGLRGIPPMSGVALRFAISSAVLLVLAYFRRVRLGASPREKWLWVVNGTLTFSLSYGIVYWCEQWVPSGLGAVLFATNPLFVALLAHILLPAEPLGRLEAIGILIGFGGVGVIFSEDFRTLGGPDVARAAAVMLFSPVASAIALVAVKRWGAGIHPFSLTAVPMGMTGIGMGMLALGVEGGRTIVWNLTSVGALLYLAIFGSVITFTLYFWLLSRIAAKRLAMISYVIPLVAVGVGTLRGEPLTARTLTGAALVVMGTALAVQR